MRVVELGDPGKQVCYKDYKCRGCDSKLEILFMDCSLVPLDPQDASAENSETAEQHAPGESDGGSADASDDNEELNGEAAPDGGDTGEPDAAKLNSSAPNGTVDWSESVDDEDGAVPGDFMPVRRNYAQIAARAEAKKAVFTCCVCQNLCRVHDKFIPMIEKHLKYAERRARHAKMHQKRTQTKNHAGKIQQPRKANGVAVAAKRK